MKVSLITAVLNCRDYISCCMDSVLEQDYDDIEYLVIDGASTDGTLDIIESQRHRISCIVTAKDEGFYEAVNKGISLATGQIIGILNADDFLANKEVISTIVKNFQEFSCDAVYGNLVYIHRSDQNQVVRKWQSGPPQRKALKYGWMPPHPTVYFKTGVYKKYGNYSQKFGYCADYELILRMLYSNEVNSVHIDRLLVKMRMGGISNNNFRRMLQGCYYDYEAIKLHHIPYPLLIVVVKKLRKIAQLLSLGERMR